MVLISGIEQAQFFQVLKLIDLIPGLAVGVHLDLIPPGGLLAGERFRPGKQISPLRFQAALCLALQHIHIGLFPIELFRSRRFIIGFQHRKEPGRKFSGQINRAVHDPLILSAYIYIGNPPLFVEGQAPFPGIALLKSGAVPGSALVGMVHIFPQPVV